jgi:hypothetical protein
MDQILHRKLINEKIELEKQIVLAENKIQELNEFLQALVAAAPELLAMAGRAAAVQAGTNIANKLTKEKEVSEDGDIKSKSVSGTNIPQNMRLRSVGSTRNSRLKGILGQPSDNQSGRSGRIQRFLNEPPKEMEESTQLDEVTSQLTGNLLRVANRRDETAQAQHNRRGELAAQQGIVPRGSPQYWSANTPLGSALPPNEREREFGLVTNAADIVTNQRQNSGSIPKGFKGTPFDVMAHETPVKKAQAEALHLIATGRESGDKDKVQAGKTKLSTLRSELARVRELRGANRDALHSHVGSPKHVKAMRMLDTQIQLNEFGPHPDEINELKDTIRAAHKDKQISLAGAQIAHRATKRLQQYGDVTHGDPNHHFGDELKPFVINY